MKRRSEFHPLVQNVRSPTYSKLRVYTVSISDQSKEMEVSNDPAEAPTPTESQKCAPTHELPTAHFYSIEYPGYVRLESVSKAIHALGGQSSVDRAFRRSAPREDSLFELNLRPDNPFSHPLLGDLVPTNNILLRVVKRKLKKRPPAPNDGDDGVQTVAGEYTAVVVGVIPKTARFRSEPSHHSLASTRTSDAAR